MQSMQVEEVPVPELGPNEVLVLVMAAGVNFNGVWAAQGKPVSVFKMHKEPFHIAGSDASGIVWKVGKEVRRWKVGDEVVIHCNQSCGQCPECNGLDPMACSEQKIWGYETSWGSVRAVHQGAGAAARAEAEAARLGRRGVVRPHLLHRLSHARRPRAGQAGRQRARVGRGRRSRHLRDADLQDPRRQPDRGRVVAGQVRPGASRSAPTGVINRKDFDFAWRAERDARADEEAHGRDQAARRRAAQADRRQGSRRRLRARRAGDVPDVACSCASASARSSSAARPRGFNLEFDVRYLWMRQKEILGSHFANAYQAERANELVHERQDQAGARPGVRLRRDRRRRTS